jgi:hypothetical protein
MNLLAGIGFSERKDPYLAACEAAKLALYQVRHRNVSLAILFATIPFCHPRLLEGISYTLGSVPLIGGSGAAIITPQGTKRYGIGLMLIAADKMTLGIGTATDVRAKGCRIAALESGHIAAKELSGHERHLALVFSDGLVENGSELLHGLKEALGTSFPIFGASCADNFRFIKTFQFANNSILSDSVVTTVFSGAITFGMGLRHGWKPLGRPHAITRVKGNVIQSIEGKPAVAIYEEYFSKTRADVVKNLVRMSAFYPLGLYAPGETEYILRNAIRADEEGGLVCQGDAAEGDEVRLMMGTKDWALDAAVQAAQEAKNTLSSPELKGVLIFESLSRSKLLGRLTDNELVRIKNVLGDVPMLGLCTFGEQAPLKSIERTGESYFHNEAIGLLTFGEPHAPGHSA